MAKKMTGLERRTIILDEAGRLFAFKGLHGTTTKEIAKAAGISEPILYQHFKSKEDIYATLEIMCSQQTAYFKKVVQDLGPGAESLVAITYLLIRVISFSKDPGTKSKAKECTPAEILLRLMGYSFLEDGRFALALVKNCIGAFFEQWHDSYKKVHKENGLTMDKADALSLWLGYEAIIGMGLFVLPAQQLIDRIGDADEGAKAATLFVLRGLGLKESLIKSSVSWPALRNFYQKAMEAGSST